jgi:hypothetical protein
MRLDELYFGDDRAVDLDKPHPVQFLMEAWESISVEVHRRARQSRAEVHQLPDQKWDDIPSIRKDKIRSRLVVMVYHLGV